MVNFGYPYNDMVICKDSTDYLVRHIAIKYYITATGQITFKSYIEAAGQIAFDTILGYLSGRRTNSKKWSEILFVRRPDKLIATA